MNVGDYVRTDDGYINKIKKVNHWNVLVDARDLFGEEISIANNEIIKSSPNIIDLIEVGDYINGIKVIDIVENDIYISDYYAESYISLVKVKDIKSIVTKEQFKNMEYKVGE